MTDPSLSMSLSSKKTSLSLQSLAARFMSTLDLDATASVHSSLWRQPATYRPRSTAASWRLLPAILDTSGVLTSSRSHMTSHHQQTQQSSVRYCLQSNNDARLPTTSQSIHRSCCRCALAAARSLADCTWLTDSSRRTAAFFTSSVKTYSYSPVATHAQLMTDLWSEINADTVALWTKKYAHRRNGGRNVKQDCVRTLALVCERGFGARQARAGRGNPIYLVWPCHPAACPPV